MVMVGKKKILKALPAEFRPDNEVVACLSIHFDKMFDCENKIKGITCMLPEDLQLGVCLSPDPIDILLQF
jgi:hypothetical protein